MLRILEGFCLKEKGSNDWKCFSSSFGKCFQNKKRFSEFWGLGESFYTVLPVPERALVLVVML